MVVTLGEPTPTGGINRDERLETGGGDGAVKRHQRLDTSQRRCDRPRRFVLELIRPPNRREREVVEGISKA